MSKRTRTDADEQRDQIIAELGGEDPETTAEREAPLEELEEPRTCECGCGAVIGKKASFAPGHDSKFKVRQPTAYDKGSESAGAELVARGWRTEVDHTARRENGKLTAERRECLRRLDVAIVVVKASSAQPRYEIAMGLPLPAEAFAGTPHRRK